MENLAGEVGSAPAAWEEMGQGGWTPAEEGGEGVCPRTDTGFEIISKFPFEERLME